MHSVTLKVHKGLISYMWMHLEKQLNGGICVSYDSLILPLIIMIMMFIKSYYDFHRSSFLRFFFFYGNHSVMLIASHPTEACTQQKAPGYCIGIPGLATKTHIVSRETAYLA